MKAIEITTPGGPDVLKISDVLAPEVKAGELLIRVVAAALNRADCMQRQGKYPPPPGICQFIGYAVAVTAKKLPETIKTKKSCHFSSVNIICSIYLCFAMLDTGNQLIPVLQ